VPDEVDGCVHAVADRGGDGVVSVVCALAPDRPTGASPACWSTTLVQVTARSAVMVIVGPIAEIVLPSAGEVDRRCGGSVWAGEIVQA
jgi:hypothetical protein